MNESQSLNNMNLSGASSTKGFEITGATLKWIAIITMLIDHIGAAILEPYAEMQMMTSGASSLWTLDMLLRGIGRLAFPIFIFLMVEGFYYTHDRKKYFFRMVLFSLISEIPFDMAFQRTLSMGWSQKIPLMDFSGQNVFFTLTLGFLAIWLTDNILSLTERKNSDGVINSEYSTEGTSEKKSSFLLVLLQIIGIFAVVVCCCYAAEYMETDYDSIGVLAMFACYLVKKKGGNYVLMMLAPVVILIFMSSSEATALVNLIFVFFYHGKKGRNINKWFFYFFYPVHLLILGITEYLII